MANSFAKCLVATNADSRWPYHQYYIGDKDGQERRNGRGENHWTGAESLEWYTGKFVRDTMHGEGEYRWRYKGPEGSFITYEGQFFGNCMHGYGVMSYPDGRVFNGIFYNDMRWGPGVESNTHRRENVGLWCGNQLIRLTWRPNTPSVTLDLNFGPPAVKTIADAHRTLLATNVRNIGEVHSAIELLKQSGASPVLASEKWTKLYPKHCNDLASQVCHVELFNHEYYKNKITKLNKIANMPNLDEEKPRNSTDTNANSEIYYAWNNSDIIISMMKHCFKHEAQRKRSDISLSTILCGGRSKYKLAAKHEFDCRNLIMSSYLGHTSRVAQLVNENNVHPDVADMLGNTALMYATCENQVDIIHFLVEAGANVNNFNDSCCTPLAMALVQFACVSNDVPLADMLKALSPIQTWNQLLRKPSEWNITRELPAPGQSEQLTKTTSNKKLNVGQKKSASAMNNDGREKLKSSFEEIKRKKTVMPDTMAVETKPESDKNKILEEEHYNLINEEFSQKVNDLFLFAGKTNTIDYLYNVSNLTSEIDGTREERKEKSPHSKEKATTAKKNTILKPSQVIMDRDFDKDEASISSEERRKIELLQKGMSTITQLLLEGADPRLVRCPQPALFTAVVSGNSDLVRNLVHYGANINEVYPDALNYTALVIALSRPLTHENLELVRTILDCGGRTDHRLTNEFTDGDMPGPTLLHAILAKNTESNSVEEEICDELLQLLLKYGCSPLEQYHGSSAIDTALTKSLKLLDIFVTSAKTDLNAIINDENQTVLVKMFSMDFFTVYPISDRLQALTNLLLYGADPLLECENNEEKYGNIFVFAKKNLTIMEQSKPQPSPVEKGKKAAEKPKKEEPRMSRLPPKPAVDNIADFRQALDLVRDCARILHIRWLQAKLMRELLCVVEKFEHRHWNMILPEHKNKKACGLWLTMPRCLEIWDIFKSNKMKKNNDRRILKHILCMVHFYCNRSKTSLKWPLTAEEMDNIETDVVLILREHKIVAVMAPKPRLGKPYVTPERAVGSAEIKFQVCFECALPLPEDKILCNFCKQVSFCSLECIKTNVEEQNDSFHACSQNLMNKYFPSPGDSFAQAVS